MVSRLNRSLADGVSLLSSKNQRASLVWLVLAIGIALLLSRLPILWAGALVVAVVVVVVTLIRPVVGLMLALLTGPFGALENSLFGNQLFDSGQVLLLLTLGSWIAGNLARKRVRIARSPLNLPILSFIAIGFISLLWAPSKVYAIRELIKWVEVWLLMQMVLDLAADLRGTAFKRFVLLIAGLLLVAGVSQALIGIWQFGIRGDGPIHFQIAEGFYRAYGTYEQPNPFGGFMHLNGGLALGTLLGLLLARFEGLQLWPVLTRRQTLSAFGQWIGRRLLRPGKIYLAIWLGGSLLIGAGLVASWSRGAWLGYAAGMALLLLLLPRKGWLGALMLSGGAGLGLVIWQAGLIPVQLLTRLTAWADDFRLGDIRGVDINDANFAVLERLAHWQAAIDMARDHLWLGVGFGNYEPAYAEYALLNWIFPLGHAHNYYLNLLAEVGIIGLIAYACLWLSVIALTWRLIGVQDWSRRGIALGLMAAWGSLTVHHLLDKLYVNNIYVHLGVMFGLLMLLERAWKRETLQHDLEGE